MQTMDDLLKMFRGLDERAIRKTPAYRLAGVLIRGLSARLGFSHALSAEIVGAMKIDVSQAAYDAEPELYDDLADEMTRVMSVVYNLLAKDFNDNTALAYLRAVASDMSLKAE